MSVLSQISLLRVRDEINECHENCESYGWLISAINEEEKTFKVFMTSPLDKEAYEIEFEFTNYPEHPYLIEFIDPRTKEKGTEYSYPKGKTDSFFHQPRRVICHPCSRKAYKGYTSLHSDWEMIGWQSIAGGITNLASILDAIFTRISDNTLYDGRMAK
jgi:hypothetical protein